MLDVRRTLLRQHGHYDLSVWENAVADWARRSRRDDVDDLVAMAGAITRYESRFPHRRAAAEERHRELGVRLRLRPRRRHGPLGFRRPLLRPPDRGTGGPAGSAGYALGRVIRFDGEQYGHMYASVLGPHRLLTADRSSPWWHLPFS